MRSLPRPADLTSLLVRVDYSDDSAWRAAHTAAVTPVLVDGDEFRARFTVVDDPAFDGATPEELATLSSDEQLWHLFIADAMTMTDPEHSLLVVGTEADQVPHPRTFRVVPAHAWGVQNNLALANLDFEEFEHAATQSQGVFRGFHDSSEGG